MNKSERLLDLLGQIDGDLIEKAAPGASSARKTGYKMWMSAAACLALVCGAGFGIWGAMNSQEPPPVIEDTVYPVKTVKTEPVLPSEETVLVDWWEETETETGDTPDTSVESSEKITMGCPDTSAALTWETSPPEDQPSSSVSTSSEVGRVPEWNERTVTEKFAEAEYGGVRYRATVGDLSAVDIGAKLGSDEMSGYDIYTDETFTIVGELYEINNVSAECVIAVKFSGIEKYFAYSNSYYSPVTLGDFIDDLNLRENMSFGSVWEQDLHGDLVEFQVDDEVIWEMLLDPNLQVMNERSDDMLVSDMSISVNIPKLGYNNISLAVTEEGYMTTNILATRKEFFIGAEKTKAFMEYVRENCEGYIIRYEAPAEEENGDTVHEEGSLAYGVTSEEIVLE